MGGADVEGSDTGEVPGSGRLEVEVVFALPERYCAQCLQLPAGATVADALAEVSHRDAFAALDVMAMPVGIFGERVEHTRRLVEGDRVELYRLLQTDPREARRQRAASSGRGGQTGRRRPGVRDR
jgi:putative ubiquitin-RnfH superfamily antitoxin RatB of RatAB toxin-antitoxin module